MDRTALRADCAQCAALCCVALAFDRSEHFAHDKPAGEACAMLSACGTCRIHGERAARGYGGCIAYDCLGAGQRATRMFAGRAWRDDPGVARAMFDAFSRLRRVHDLLLLLDQAGRLSLTPAQRLTCGQLWAMLAAADTPEALAALERTRVEAQVLQFLASLKPAASRVRG